MSVPHSRLAGLSAILIAAAAHAGAAFLTDTEKAEQAGGNTGLAARGYAFADLVQGSDVPVVAEELFESEAAETTVRPAPDKVQEPAPQPLQPSTEAVQAEAVAMHALVPNALPSKKPGPALWEEAVTTAPPLENVPVQPQGRAKVQPPEQHQFEKVESPAKPEVQEPLVEPEAKPEPRPNPPPRKTQRRGNNTEQNAAQGTASGTVAKSSGQATTSPGTAKQQGNAAADNYRGQVLRRVMRAKRQRVNIRGAALVRFSIAASGNLRSASITRSSGSAKLDSIALAQVRRAAPFPPPPAGATTTYTVRIKGK